MNELTTINETVTINIEAYNGLIESDFALVQRNKELYEDELYIKSLKEILLELCVNDYSFKHETIEKITDIKDYCFGLNNVTQLLKVFTYEELIEFIRNKKKEYEEREKE